MGDGLESTTVMGPVQNHLQFDRVKSLLADIQSHGLKLTAGSTSPSDAGKGYFITPAVVDNPPDASRIVVEEPFGMFLFRFSDMTLTLLGPVFPVLNARTRMRSLDAPMITPWVLVPRFGPQTWRRQRG